MLPSFTTARLCLTPATDADLDALWALWRDPLVRRYLWDDAEIERERVLEALQGAAALAPRGLGLWTIALADDSGAFIGCAALLPVGASAEYYPPLAGAIEPLIALAPEFWHRAYAQEALAPLIEHAIDTLRLDRLVAVADAPNDASLALLRRLGFVFRAETDGPRYRLRHFTLEGNRSVR